MNLTGARLSRLAAGLWRRWLPQMTSAEPMQGSRAASPGKRMSLLSSVTETTTSARPIEVTVVANHRRFGNIMRGNASMLPISNSNARNGSK